MFVIRSGPSMPSGKPGKFSIPAVVVSAPPTKIASPKTSGSSSARAG